MSDGQSSAFLKQDETGVSAAIQKQGLLLHPEIATKWESIGVKDAPERIFAMAEKEGKRRFILKLAGTFTGLLVVILIVGLCGFMVYRGQGLEALGTIVGSLATIFGMAAYIDNKQP